MDRYVMRSPANGLLALIPESSMPHHRDVLGWTRHSDGIPEGVARGVDLRDYTDAPDLDAATPATEDTPADAPADQSEDIDQAEPEE